uniref:Uncharacterized protein n=1 Tax=Anguilla anguilla TaxID=7936 RepID=A0A0E9WTA0_ANGAN
MRESGMRELFDHHFLHVPDITSFMCPTSLPSCARHHFLHVPHITSFMCPTSLPSCDRVLAEPGRDSLFQILSFTTTAPFA